MKSDVIMKLHKSFEDYAHDVNGEEFWFARELQALFGYIQLRNFELVIDKAKIACETAGHSVADHFTDVSKMVDIGSGSQREVDDIMLTR
jgi:DNA-damage-inducible protein D